MIKGLSKSSVDIVWTASSVFEGRLSGHLLSSGMQVSGNGPETLAVAVTHAGGHLTAYAYTFPNGSVGGVFVSNYDMMMLHRHGLGREFRMTGRHDMHIEWRKGDRFSASMLHLKKATQPVVPVENGKGPANLIFIR